MQSPAGSKADRTRSKAVRSSPVNIFGIEQTFRGFAGVSQRCAFLIDADGTVRNTWLYEITEVPDLDAVVTAAQALRSSPASS